MLDGIRYRSDLRKAYHAEALRHHPDLGPPEEADARTAYMKALNARYELLFAILPENDRDKTAAGERRDSDETAYDYPEAICKILHIPGIKVEICGSWIWVTGSTYPVKDRLREAGYEWSKSKVAWYWKPAGGLRRKRGYYSLDKIRHVYGSEEVEGQPHAQVG